ncbi:hypothetical protein BGZ80_009511 [Entomortierella chlamydospora]|uniref:Uncharacterized protein n=1 Tax=Entomortierella chlamydospora TaxID=101097 RepID=A0A9P6T0K6_9FUNG|nr:hypothetical protein BGZ80_009511 [Entomortierella chlamydospora]
MRIQWSDLKTFDIIGSGSFGRVFHGDLLGTEVAIKECVRSNSRAFDEKYFKREVNILKQSRHPNIVQFMGICKRKKKFYIVTEFLPLGNLRRWIQDETKEFGWDTRISFAIDISLALAYLHHKNIIHRDLKGENLLISENMRIKAPEILLGEDFDCSVDVFSFGVVLAEMMARHVVDPQHFQRVSPDMGISPDEILFRAQPGCPLELGELAIHCVQPLPQHRPKLREVVERLTAIESVDVHVGTTLVVAPSVARAARNIMRKREQQQHQKDLYQGNLQFDQSSPDTNSSVCGNAHTWRMTDEENASSRRIESSVIGSTSTYKGNRWIENQAHQFQTGSSAIPLVLENRRQDRDGNHDHEGQVATASDNSCQGDEDTTFRMPLWDSINSPQNQEVLRQWHESASVDISTVDGEGNIQSWSQERLSSIQCNLDDDSDSDYSLGSDDTDEEGGGNDEYIDSLLNEDSDDEIGDSQEQSIEMYELSSDSDESLSSGSLTESVVMALDNLEIPDLMTTLPEKNLPVESQASLPPATTKHPYSGPENGNDKVNLFRKPSLISRLLPPIPTSENPWKADEAIQDLQAQGNSESAGRAADRTMAYATTVEVLLPPQKLYSNDNLMNGTDPSTPPPPPSKSSILLRTNTIKSLRQPPSNLDSTPHQDVDSGNLGSETIGSASNSTATSKSSSSSPSLSSTSSNSEDPKLDGNHATGGVHNRGQGLIRGMSDSALESASNAIEAGGTIAGNIIAAMGAKTWTSGTGGFGQWIGHHAQHDDQSGETKLKKHTSLKEGKQQRALASRLSKLNGLSVQEMENEGVEGNDVGRPDPSPIVKRRAQKPLTGFPHRFSLVVFSTQLLPKCDACQKRLGVLPGWASKHLECDDCGYKTHPKCVPNVAKNCTSARKSGVWEIPV